MAAKDGRIGFWTGTEWVYKPVNKWTGTSWVAKGLSNWNGTAWVLSGVATSPSTVSTLSFATASPYSGPTLVLPTDTRITKTSMIPLAITSVTPNFFVNNATSQGNTAPAAWETEFNVSGNEVAFKFRASPTANSHLQFFVNDVPLTENPGLPTGITLAAGTVYWARIQFDNPGPHKVTARGRYAGYYHAELPAGISISATTPANKRIACFGASYTAVLEGAYTQLQTWPWLVGDDSRIDANVLQAGIGATGYFEHATLNYNATARIDKIVEWNPEYLIVEGSGNDDTHTYADVNTAATNFFSTMKTRLPNTKILVIGAMPTNDVRSIDAGRARNLKAVRDAANAATNVIGFVDPLGTVDPLPAYTAGASYAAAARVSYLGAVYEAKAALTNVPAALNTADWNLLSWFTGTGNIGAPTGDGNRDTMLHSDDAHPTIAGQKLIAQKIADAFVAVTGGTTDPVEPTEPTTTTLYPSATSYPGATTYPKTGGGSSGTVNENPYPDTSLYPDANVYPAADSVAPVTSSAPVLMYYPAYARGNDSPGQTTMTNFPWSSTTLVSDFAANLDANGNVTPNTTYNDGVVSGNGWTLAGGSELCDYAYRVGKKVVLCIGGAGTSNSFNNVTSTPEARANVAKNIADTLATAGYSGVDLDPEPSRDTLYLGELVAAIVSEFTARGWRTPGTANFKTISVAVDGGSVTAAKAAAKNGADWVAPMIYAPYSTTAHHLSPINPPSAYTNTSDWKYVVDNYTTGTDAMPVSKIMFGFSFSVWRWRDVTAQGQVATTYDQSMHWETIRPAIGNAVTPTNVTYDSVAKMHTFVGSTTGNGGTANGVTATGWHTFETDRSIADKAAYVASLGAGGVVVWHVGNGTQSAGVNELASSVQNRFSTEPATAYPGYYIQDFDVNDGGWVSSTGAPTILRTDARKHQGTHSLQFTSTAAGTARARSGLIKGIPAGSTRTAKVYLANGTTARNMNIFVETYTAAGGWLTSASGTIVTPAVGGAFLESSLTFTMGATAEAVRIYATASATVAGEVFYVDQITLV